MKSCGPRNFETAEMKSVRPAGVGEMPCATAGHAGVPDLWRMEDVRRDSTVEKDEVVWKVMRVAVMGLVSFCGGIVRRMVSFREDARCSSVFEIRYVY
jgi:hypothetical protein